LTFQIDGSGDFWWCGYYSHYTKSHNENIPKQKGNTIEEAALHMINYIENLKIKS
jgi:hypothetical protein